MDKIVPAFEVSLFDPTLVEACSDFVEAGIDSVLNDGVLKGIPIVGLVVGAGKTAQNIHDRNLLRQTLRFINSFNNGTVKPDKVEKYRKKLKDNPKKAEEELGRVIILLNSNVDLKKSDILGKFYKAYVNEDLNWVQFCELSDVTNRLFISDINLLLQITHGEVKDTKHCISYQAERLNSLGLVDMVIQSLTISTVQSETSKVVETSDLGKRFVKFGIDY